MDATRDDSCSRRGDTSAGCPWKSVPRMCPVHAGHRSTLTRRRPLAAKTRQLLMLDMVVEGRGVSERRFVATITQHSGSQSTPTVAPFHARIRFASDFAMAARKLSPKWRTSSSDCRMVSIWPHTSSSDCRMVCIWPHASSSDCFRVSQCSRSASRSTWQSRSSSRSRLAAARRLPARRKATRLPPVQHPGAVVVLGTTASGAASGAASGVAFVGATSGAACARDTVVSGRGCGVVATSMMGFRSERTMGGGHATNGCAARPQFSVAPMVGRTHASAS